MSRLGAETIPAIVQDGDEVEAELWEIAECPKDIWRATLSPIKRGSQNKRAPTLEALKSSSHSLNSTGGS
jgi:hypothetical protein